MSGKHINFQANNTDMERIEILRRHISENLAGSHVSFTTVIRNALSIAVKHIGHEPIKASPFKN